eukprot:TRINITY_DN1556_c0_g1_i7.p1 TRINITY_DN1556_c0_g1~~TRINITY_DN1556_c0_g1_i7.p1  ORF type:complete len:568 (-),score=81.15 TRINITY_DN1556_c0_g1_i7:476-2179(-)
MQHIGKPTYSPCPFTQQPPKKPRHFQKHILCKAKPDETESSQQAQTAQERLQANLKNLSRQEARALSKTNYFVGVVGVVTATAVQKSVGAVVCGVQALTKESTKEKQPNLRRIVEGAGQKLESFAESVTYNQDVEEATQQILQSTVTDSKSASLKEEIKLDVNSVKLAGEQEFKTRKEEEIKTILDEDLPLSPREILDPVSYPRAQFAFKSTDEVSDAFSSLDFMDHAKCSIDTKLEDRMFDDFDFDICDRPVGPYNILKWFEQGDTNQTNLTNAVEKSKASVSDLEFRDETDVSNLIQDGEKTQDEIKEIDISKLTWVGEKAPKDSKEVDTSKLAFVGEESQDQGKQIDISNFEQVGEKTKTQSKEIDIQNLKWVGEVNIDQQSTDTCTYVHSSAFDGRSLSKQVQFSKPEVIPELSVRPVPIEVVKMQYFKVGAERKNIDDSLSKLQSETSNGSVPTESISKSPEISIEKPQQSVKDNTLTKERYEDEQKSTSKVNNGLDFQKVKRDAYMKKLEEDVGDASWLLPLVSVYVVLLPQFQILQSQVWSKKDSEVTNKSDRITTSPKL